MLQTVLARLARRIAAGGRKLMAAVNAITNVGYHVGGRFTATASGAIVDGTLVKFASTGVVAANDGVPCGVALSAADTATEVGVQALGGAGRSVVMLASELIAAGTKVKTLPVAGGTYYIVGQALTAAAADGDQVEVAPCAPVKIVVS
jgi:hypothetical protein